VRAEREAIQRAEERLRQVQQGQTPGTPPQGSSQPQSTPPASPPSGGTSPSNPPTR
jgi:hypothetical protein